MRTMSTNLMHRRGLTLVELVVSAALSVAIVGAGMTLIWSVSRESALTESDRAAMAAGQAALRRIVSLIHGSRAVNLDSSSQLTLWNVDDYPTPGSGGVPGDDVPQVSEVETLVYNAGKRTIVREYVDFTGASAATVSLLNTNLGVPGIAVVSLGGVLSLVPGLNPYVKSDTIATQVESCTFTSVTKGGRPVIVGVNISIALGKSVQSFARTINLVGPAYFVNNAAARTNDGVSGGRYRGTIAWSW